jgi:hypothetical protein
MMMGGMGYSGFIGGLLAVFMILGYAYIIWILALKEKDWIRTTGLVFSCGIAILLLLAVLYSGFSGGWCGGSKKYYRMRKDGKSLPMEERKEMMEKKMKEYAK